MLIKELIAKIKCNRGCCIKAGEYEVQIYSNGKLGNIMRGKGGLVCAFDLEDGRIVIAPAKPDIPYQFGYTGYGIEVNEEMPNLASINHKDSTEIYEAFISFMQNY